MTENQNEICQRQNDPHGIKLLSARQRTFQIANYALLSQIALMVILPLAAWSYFAISGEGRAIIASSILFITLFDILFLDRIYREKIVSASRISQEFDCYVFGFQPDNLFYNNPEDFELIAERSSKYLNSVGSEKLTDWYGSMICNVARPFATLVAQRTNVTYDRQVRDTYRLAIFVTLSIIIVSMVLVTLSMEKPLSFLITALFLPAAPLLIWSFREWHRQKDAVDEAARLQSYIESILNGYISGQISHEQGFDEAQRIQNAIYLWRAKNPLSFPGIYKLRRTNLESNMGDASEHWVRKLESGE